MKNVERRDTKMRKKIFRVIEIQEDEDKKISCLYAYFMIFCIIISLIPLAYKETNAVFDIIEGVTVTIFIIDYFLRWMTADLKLKKGKRSFLMYPFTFVAIIDLLSILPAFTAMNKVLKSFRILRLIKVLRVFKTFRYSTNIKRLSKVFKKEKSNLITVLYLSLGYIVISALAIFSIEPDTFNSFFEALYWATVSLTTVGYGDISPVTGGGRFLSMISALFGIAIIAIPSGIITAGYLDEIQNNPK